jgi:hypothetical protein
VDKAVTTNPDKTRLRASLALAIAADLLQIAVFPLFMEGAASPADDILDFTVAGILTYLLGWHWEFLPTFLAELVPGAGMVPFWTLAVANVYRKTRRIENEPGAPIIQGEPVRKA